MKQKIETTRWVCDLCHGAISGGMVEKPLSPSSAFTSPELLQFHEECAVTFTNWRMCQMLADSVYEKELINETN